MKKKKKTTAELKTDEDFYISFDPEDQKSVAQALSTHSSSFDGENFIQRADASLGFSDILPNQSVRKQFRQADYDAFRSAEALPTSFKGVIFAIQAMYRNVGIIKTAIDLMSDFACEGLRFEHSVRGQQQWYNAWSTRINLQNIVHNFMLNLLRDGNVIIRRTTAKISVKQNKKFMRGQAKPDIKVEKETKNVLQREIPWSYLFISPAVVTVEGGAAGEFTNKTLLSVEIPRKLITMVKRPKNDIEKAIIKELPEDVLKAINAGQKKVLLDMTKVSVSHYKKADWEQWATPLLFPVLSDVMFKKKMRLADLAALDGIINVIRIWKLGDHTAKPPILPKTAAKNKLLAMLKSNVGGGVVDLVWDSMIKLEVEYPPVKDILGSEKYEQVDKDIMIGLGVPDILLGGNGANFSNAFLQLKTLTERLEYVRVRTLEWLRKEIKLIMEAQGWKNPPHIVFERTNLKDEMAQKQLLIQMFDRNLLSAETLQKEFQADFIVELERSRREEKVRQENPGVMPKQGPFVKDEIPTDAPPNPEDNGRPPNTPDITQRERKNINPRGDLCDLLLNADKLQGTIDLEVDKIYLKRIGVKNIKSLKADQKVALEDTKTYLLFNCDVDTIIGLKYIEAVLQTPTDFYKKIVGHYRTQLNNFVVKNNREPRLGENKKLKSFAWAEIHNEG